MCEQFKNVNSLTDISIYLFIYLFNNIYTGSKYHLENLFFLQSPV